MCEAPKTPDGIAMALRGGVAAYARRPKILDCIAMAVGVNCIATAVRVPPLLRGAQTVNFIVMTVEVDFIYMRAGLSPRR